jgi:hypothetical protein
VSWSTSDRRARLPADWPAIRAKVKARAHGRCEAEHHAPGCLGTGNDADHIQAGDDHSLANLQWLSTPCHRAKTARETAARNRTRAAMRKRPAEPHPGGNPMKITLTKAVGGHKEGATIEVPDEIAERLVLRGVAEKPKAAAKKD